MIRNKQMTTMDIKELLNRTDRFAANAGCRITEVDEQHAVAEMTVTMMHRAVYVGRLGHCGLDELQRSADVWHQ